MVRQTHWRAAARPERVVAAALVFLAASGASAQRYTITPLPVAEGYHSAWAAGINNHGEMCGISFDGVLGHVACLWRGGQVFALPRLTRRERPPYRSWGEDINDDGIVIGTDHNGPYPQQAVMWPDVQTIVPILDRDSGADAVNNDLTVAGNYAVGFLDFRGFVLWKGGQWLSLDLIHFIDDLNNRDVVIGSTNFQSWRWENGVFTATVPLRPGASSRARCINDDGVMGGWSAKEPGTYYPVFWVNDVPREMPSIGQGGGIQRLNNAGLATGWVLVTPEWGSPSIWRNNLVTELDDLIIDRGGPAPVRIDLHDINDVGQMAVSLRFEMHAVAARVDPVDVGLTLWGFEPSRPGRRNTITVKHATPGGRVSLLWGTSRGEPQPLTQCNDAKVSIVSPRVAATTTARSNGQAVFNVRIPANAEGLYVLQAVDHATCEVSPPSWALLKMEN